MNPLDTGATPGRHGHGMALFTDLYELTMAYGYWKAGMAELETTFHLSFRRNPFEGGFAVACGLGPALEWVSALRFEEDDLDYLGSLTGADGQPLFESGFLGYLAQMDLSLDIDAMPEGTVCFAQEPLVRVQGGALACQLVETALLNIVNFQTMVATKAARVCLAARDEPVMEFGARRAQGMDGALSASRAAFIGGCAATSNVLAGKRYGIPVGGTHAHSWVMLFDSELEAFEQYAQALPNNCVFLVDTYDTLEGVRHAVQVGHKLRAQGHDLLGVRLDSGDLAYLSARAREILDAAGFPNAKIYASNDLDEYLITSLKDQGAQIGVWGVGTRLVTGHDQGALGGVYKLSAVRQAGESQWQPRLKLSEQSVKISTPGVLQVRRYRENGAHGARNRADLIYEVGQEPAPGANLVDVTDPLRRTRLDAGWEYTDLLEPQMRAGKLCNPAQYADEAMSVDHGPGGEWRGEPLAELTVARDRARTQMEQFYSGVKRFLNPHIYPVGLEEGLFRRKADLVLSRRLGS